MKRNVCGLDRTVRLVFGTLLTLAVFLTWRNRNDPDRIAIWQIAATYTAAELLITGLLRWCPGNYLLGIDTCEQDPVTALQTVRRRLPSLS